MGMMMMGDRDGGRESRLLSLGMAKLFDGMDDFMTVFFSSCFLASMMGSKDVNLIQDLMSIID